MSFILDSGDIPIIDIGFIEADCDFVVSESIDFAFGIKETLEVFAILFCCLDEFLLFEEFVSDDELLSV